ncbi:MAG: TM1802 family CRISPR-associated protein [Candidatus Odinarchaeota archaeon]
MIDGIGKIGLVHLNSILRDSTYHEFYPLHITNVPAFFTEITVSDPAFLARLLTESPDHASNIDLYVIDTDGGMIQKEEWDSGDLGKYLFMARGGKQDYYAPTFQASFSLQGKGKIKPDGFFDKWRVVPGIRDAYLNNREEIVKLWTKKTDGKRRILFTFKHGGKYPGEIEPVATTFLRRYMTSIATANGRISEGNGECAVCSQDGIKVYGDAKPYNFFTVSKDAFFHEFDRKNSWKALPVCLNCSYLLTLGKSCIDDSLDSRMGSFKAKIIPRFHDLSDMDATLENLTVFRNFSRCLSNLADHGDEAWSLVSKLESLDSSCICSFLLYHINNAQFEILSVIDSVSPTRLARIVSAVIRLDEKYRSDQDTIYRSFRERNENLKQLFSFDSFFLQSLLADDTDQLELISSVFSSNTISDVRLFRLIESKLIESLRTYNSPRFTMSRYIQLLEFLKAVDVLETRKIYGGLTMAETIPIDCSKFLPDQVASLTTHEQVCFLTGALFGKLERVHHVLNKPFRLDNYDHGTALTEKRIKALVTEMIALFKHCSSGRGFSSRGPKKFYSKDVDRLITFISKSLLSTGPWNIERERIAFLFFSGWTLSSEILPAKTYKVEIQGEKQNE